MVNDAQVPAVSSRELESALKKLGFKAGKTSGSHRAYRLKGNPDRTCTVVTGKSEIPDGTTRSALRQAGIEPSEFLLALGGKHKKAEKRRLKAIKTKGHKKTGGPKRTTRAR